MDFIKGEPVTANDRIEQVSTISLKCPLLADCVKSFHSMIKIMMPSLQCEEDEFGDIIYKNVAYFDVLSVLLSSVRCCKNGNIDLDVLCGMTSILKTFTGLKRVNLIFTSDPSIWGVYLSIIGCDDANLKSELYKGIYSMDEMTINLSDMFNQEIIDHFNKYLMFDGLLPNSHLDRCFEVEFEFDQYVSYTDMMINNNIDKFSTYGDGVLNNFKMFPPIIIEKSPRIVLITNYNF